MSDERLQSDVADELYWDPKVDGAAIAVSAQDGVVTLRGTVGTFREKREAQKDAESVHGAKRVENELEVRILDDDRRADAELRGDVLQALMLDSLVPDTVDAEVDDGVVTLSGEANWQYQRDEADFVAANILGVVDVDNKIELVAPGPTPENLTRRITDAMERNAKLDAESLEVESANGTVTLRGEVSSWADHDAAIAAAWAAPGVTKVKDHIIVTY
jgi:osmotically-inducible protein OsmY